MSLLGSSADSLAKSLTEKFSGITPEMAPEIVKHFEDFLSTSTSVEASTAANINQLALKFGELSDLARSFIELYKDGFKVVPIGVGSSQTKT